MGYYTYYTMEAKNAKTGAHIDKELEAKICQRLYEISEGQSLMMTPSMAVWVTI